MAGEWQGGRVAATGFGPVLRDAQARGLLLIALVNAAPVAITSTLFLFYVESRLDAPGWEGAYLLLFFLCAALAAPLWGALAERHGARPMLLAAMVLSIAAFGWASQQDMDDILSLALRVNDFLSGVMYGVGIRLVDFKIEIGRVYDGDYQRLIVADEISPDSCRLWDIETGQKLDKDVFRRDLGSLTEAYTEVARHLGVMPKANVSASKPTLIN